MSSGDYPALCIHGPVRQHYVNQSNRSQGTALSLRDWTRRFLLYTLLLAAAARTAHSARILLVPLASESHTAAFTALSTALEHHGGHEIHMVVTDNLLEASKAMAASRNASHAHSYTTYPLRYDLLPKELAIMAKTNSIRAMAIGYKVLAAMIDSVIGNKQLLQEVTDLQPDLIIGDASASFGHWLTTLTGIPGIDFDVGTSSGLLHSMHGGQFNPAYLPAPGTFYPSTGMTLQQRCVNTAATLAVRAMAHFHWNYGPIRALANRRGIQHLPGSGPSRPLLLLVNFDWALEPARPIGPAIKYLGPLMPREPAELPEDLRAWLEGSEGNDAPGKQRLPVVYLSFGASFAAPEAAVPAVAAAVAASRSKMRFIISMKEAEQQLLKGAWQYLKQDVRPDEVLLREDVPQNDLLGYGGLAAFVTQGGYLSMQEAAYHAVPLISIPLSLGQEEISQFAVDQGRGLLVRKETLMAGNHRPLLDALLQAVANNSAYKQQAQLVAARLRAHPRSPGQHAADWVAYALANPPGSGSFLHTQGQNQAWWQVLLLDVLAVYAVGVVAVALLLWLLVKVLRVPAEQQTAGQLAAGPIAATAAASRQQAVTHKGAKVA